MLFKLSENQETVKLTKNQIFITVNVNPQTKYILEGKIASDVLSHNSALFSIQFLDSDQNVIEKPYEGFALSTVKGVGYYKYIPINSKSMSAFQIKMRTHPEAHYLRCSFQSWGIPKAAVFLASEIEFVEQKEKLNVSSSILLNKEISTSQDLRFVLDEEGRKLYYDVRLAFNNPQESPILICFHGWTGNNNGLGGRCCYSWNLVKPLDRFGYRKNGSWWLGENGDFFVLSLIDKMLEDIREELGLVGDLFVWGSSMGGFGALIHGLRLNVKAIAVNVPQVRLVGTEFSLKYKREFEVVLGADVASLSYDELVKLFHKYENSQLMYTDATFLLNYSKPVKNPTFFISQSRFDEVDENESRLYAKQHCFHLVNKLLDLGCNFELYIEPKEGHYFIRDWFEAIELFEKYQEIINSPVWYQNLECQPREGIKVLGNRLNSATTVRNTAKIINQVIGNDAPSKAVKLVEEKLNSQQFASAENSSILSSYWYASQKDPKIRLTILSKERVKIFLDLKEPGDKTYIITSDIAFNKPPKKIPDWKIKPSQKYYVYLNVSFIIGSIEGILWFREYSESDRLKDTKTEIKNGETKLEVMTHPNAKYFRVAIRLTGSGVWEVEKPVLYEVKI